MYNRIMGGIDGLDQSVEVYRPYLKTVSWVTRFLTHVLTIVETNAFIWTKSYLEKKKLGFKKYNSHKSWRLDVVQEFCHYELLQQELEEGDIKQRTHDKKKWNKDYSRLRGRHFVLEMGLNEVLRATGGIQTRHTQEEFDEALKRKNKFKRSNCILCATKVSTQCEQCNVFLCTKTVPGVTQKWRHNALCQRCVNVVDNLGFPHLCMDKLNVFTDKTMSFVMYC